jgi:ribosome-binding protein aMBF1 (putative translation factor)
LEWYRIFQYWFSDLTTFPRCVTEVAAMWVEVEHYNMVGACLAAARRRLGVTQDELAARLGKPQSFVSEYERGQRRVDVVELLVISRALGVDPLDLFTEIAKTVGASRAATPSVTP